MGRIVAVAVLLTIAASGCANSNSSSDSTLAATPAAVKPARLGCPRLSEAARLPYRPGGGRLRGDIDGDGHLDRVSIRYSPAAPARCGIVLVVDTQAKAFALPVAWEYKPGLENVRARDVWTPEPYLAAIVQLDPSRSQIVIARDHGASNAFVSFVGIVDGKLVLLPFRPREYADELSLLGSVGVGVTNARCRRGGALVVLGVGPTSYSGKRWYFIRTQYRLTNGLLRRTSTSTTTKGSRKRIYALARQAGMDELPFTGCTTARGRRLG
jgi:hypothetical protein